MSITSLARAPRRPPDEAGESALVRLFEVDPDLGRCLTPEEHHSVDSLVVPARTVPDNHVEVSTLLVEANAFGALVLEGMLIRHVRIGDRPSLRLLGSGDVFFIGGEPSTGLLAESRCSADAGTRIALLGKNILIAAHRAPRILQGLLARIAEQAERDAAHLAISQLPRVEHRLMAIMWLLAEKWGYVTPAGTVLPLSLTHETLGGLIGARRPTVSLALGELAERGQLRRGDRGWLIVEPPPDASADWQVADAPHARLTPGDDVAFSSQLVLTGRRGARG